MTTQSRPMMTSLPAIVTMLIALVLFVLVGLRWQQIGWGEWVWLAAFIATGVIRTPHARRNRANVVVDARKDVTEMLLLLGMFVAGMILPLFHLATGLLAFADYALPDWATTIGVLLQLPYIWLFWRSHADLGRNWSPGLEVRQEHGLVTNGVYAGICHPMYAAIWISAVAQPLLIHNWIAGALVVPAFAAMWFLRVPREEAMMRVQFGEAYDQYCRKAGRLLPKG